MRAQLSTFRKDSRRGAAAVELGLVMPLLVVLLLGAVDFGRYAHSYIALTNASREGAAFGSINPFTAGTQANWQTQVRQRVADEMKSIMDRDRFAPGDLVVSATRAVEPDGFWRVRVEARYPFETLVNWPGIPRQVSMRRVVEMRGIR